jgi:hypothetical protein
MSWAQLLSEHGANGTTLVVCLVAVWRLAQASLGAYRERTVAIREAVDAVQGVATALHHIRPNSQPGESRPSAAA